MKKIKTQLNDYLNMNVIKLSMVITLNYRYGINIIDTTACSQCYYVRVILDTKCVNVNKTM